MNSLIISTSEGGGEIEAKRSVLPIALEDAYKKGPSGFGLLKYFNHLIA